MDILDIVRNSRENRNFKELEGYFDSKPEALHKLINLVIDQEAYPIQEYASWIALHITKSKPQSTKPYYNSFVDIVFNTKNQSVLRNVICCISHLSISTYKESEFIDLLISFVQDNKNKVALQVYSIYVLIQFVKKHPELKAEIEQVIELNSLNKSPAFSIAKRNFHSSLKNL